MSRKRILVVEDNEDNRRILLYRLRKIGDFEIVETANGAEAVAAVESNPPDLIFMDLKMPVMDGWEATRRIREMEAHRQSLRTVILALTADAMEGSSVACREAGMDGFLTKPISSSQLAQELEKRLAPLTVSL